MQTNRHHLAPPPHPGHMNFTAMELLDPFQRASSGGSVGNGLAFLASPAPTNIADQHMFTPLANATPSATTPAWNYSLAQGATNSHAWPSWPGRGSSGQHGSTSLGIGQLDPSAFPEHVGFSLTPVAPAPPPAVAQPQAVIASRSAQSEDTAMPDLDYSATGNAGPQASPLVTVSPPSFLSSVPVVQSHTSSDSASSKATAFATDGSANSNANSFSLPSTTSGSTSSRNSPALMDITSHGEKAHGLKRDRNAPIRVSTASDVSLATRLLNSPNSATALGLGAESPSSPYSTRAANKKARHVQVKGEKELAMSDPLRTRTLPRTPNLRQESNTSVTSPLVGPLSRLMHQRTSSSHAHTEGEGSDSEMSTSFTLPRESPKQGSVSCSATPAGRKRGVKRDASGPFSGGRAQLSPSALISGCEPLPLPTEDDGVITGSGNGLAAGVTIPKPVPGKRGGGFSCHCCKTSKRNIDELFLCTNILPKNPQSEESVRAAKQATEALWSGKAPSQGNMMEDDEGDSKVTAGQKKCKKKYCLQVSIEKTEHRSSLSACVFSHCSLFYPFVLQCMRRLYPRELQTLRGPDQDQWQCPSCMNRCSCAGCERKVTGHAEAPWRRKKGAKQEEGDSPSSRKRGLKKAGSGKKTKEDGPRAPLTLRGGSRKEDAESLDEDENEEDEEGEESVDRARHPNEAVSRFQSFHTRPMSLSLQGDLSETMSNEYDAFSLYDKTHTLNRFQLPKTPPVPMDTNFTVAAAYPRTTPPAAYCRPLNQQQRTIIPHEQLHSQSNPTPPRGIAQVPSPSHQAQASPSHGAASGHLDARRREQHQLGINMMRIQMQNLKGDERSRFVGVDDKDMKDVAAPTQYNAGPNVELEQVLLEKHRRLVEQQRITNELLAQIQARRADHGEWEQQKHQASQQQHHHQQQQSQYSHSPHNPHVSAFPDPQHQFRFNPNIAMTPSGKSSEIRSPVFTSRTLSTGEPAA
jgi:hypothetical protein